MNKRISTTVKVEEALYNEFKVLGVRHKLSLQGLVERVIYRYVKEDDFRDAVNNFILPITSGAEFPLRMTASLLTPSAE
jgi:hypothetical protein